MSYAAMSCQDYLWKCMGTRRIALDLDRDESEKQYLPSSHSAIPEGVSISSVKDSPGPYAPHRTPNPI